MNRLSAVTVLCLVHAATSVAPSGLLCNFQKSPALGVQRAQPAVCMDCAVCADCVDQPGPQFAWIVPPCGSGPDHEQVAYHIVVKDGSGANVWDTGTVEDPSSSGVRYGGPPLVGGATYHWTVQTTTKASSQCVSDVSESAAFIVALAAQDWSPNASWIWSNNSKGKFAFLRRVVQVPSGQAVESATVFVTAMTDDYVLEGYRLYIAGKLINVGPGRGEAPVWNSNGTFMDKPYTTLDVTEYFTGNNPAVVALRGLASSGDHGSNKGHGVLLQLNLKLSGGDDLIVATDDTWSSFDADPYVNPGPGHNWYKHVLENTDARQEPVGWCEDPAFTSEHFVPASVGPLAAHAVGLHPKMAKPVQVIQASASDAPKIEKINASWYFVDFHKEFQGGLVFSTKSGVAGQKVMIISGESRQYTDPKNKTDKGPVTSIVGDTWGYNFTWTLREGEQSIEQHQYMEFRYVNLVFIDGPAPADFDISAWRVQYEWDEGDTYFDSDNSTLNAVWDLNTYTQRAGILDTYTDSNTRERKPYEADGLVAASSHLWVQRDFMWARHSHSYVIQNPTWPVEWVQISVLLAQLDFWATAQADVAGAYMELLSNNTRLMDADNTGLLNCSAQVANGCSSRPGRGHHIIDWFPGPSGKMFKNSEHTSVNNAFAVRGLQILADLAGVLNLKEESAEFKEKATTLLNTMKAQMWDGNGTGSWCDGICSDVAWHNGVTTDAWALWMNLVPKGAVADAWSRVAQWGNKGFGAYGVFVFLSALNSYAGDDGEATLTALTKCDTQSWCGEMKTYNATMTRESWAGGTYSHPWATGAIVGVAGGIMGVTQTAPGFAKFTVKPRLGSLKRASIRIPTLPGYIDINATQATLTVAVPCGTAAKLCARHFASDDAAAKGLTLVLDGEVVLGATVEELWLCSSPNVGCGKGGASRTVTVQHNRIWL